MCDYTSLKDTRRLSISNSKSRATILKRQSSGYIPLLSANSHSLSNVTNYPQRSAVNRGSKRKIDEYENDSLEYDVPTSNYASVRKQQQHLQSSSSKRIKPQLSLISVCSSSFYK